MLSETNGIYRRKKFRGGGECVATIREAQALSISSMDIFFTVTDVSSGNAIGKINKREFMQC